MASAVKPPATSPCGSCPYRRDVPSGIWAAEEYKKLPAYDQDTAYQPAGVFLCHQVNGHMCAGWVGCHGASNLLALRLAAAYGHLPDDDLDAALSYESPVPLFATGQEAADHGLADLEHPDDRARKAIDKLTRRRAA